jgi:hypothetical protein
MDEDSAHMQPKLHRNFSDSNHMLISRCIGSDMDLGRLSSLVVPPRL